MVLDGMGGDETGRTGRNGTGGEETRRDVTVRGGVERDRTR